MRTLTKPWLLLSLFTVSALAQVPATPNPMRVDPALQRERDNTRMGILQDELSKETRELTNAENELQSAQASRASIDKIQEAAARVTLHRRNVSALMREITLVKVPSDFVTGSSEVRQVSTRPQERQPNNWLILHTQPSTGDEGAATNTLLRRRLPLADSGNSRPQWIIPSAYTGIGP